MLRSPKISPTNDHNAGGAQTDAEYVFQKTSLKRQYFDFDFHAALIF